MANNIIDSIQLSGVTYQIQGSGGGVPESTFTAYTATTDSRIAEDEEVTAAGLNALNDKITPTVELTQAQYDALVTAGTVSADTYYIITDATPVDMSNYYTTAQTNTLLAGKQATLVSGTNIKTINNESLLGSGNIDIQGGGKAIEAGRGISITTGETADTVSFNLPISAGTGTNTLLFQSGRQQSGNAQRAVAFGRAQIKSSAHDSAAFGTSYAEAQNAFAEGSACHAAGNASHAEGLQTTAYTQASHTEGNFTEAKNFAEHASGQYNNSVSASTTFGDSGNTLFSVGNGTSNSSRHNAFEIRQNGDIYLSSGGTDIKLQDHLGGGGTVDQTIISGSTNAVAGGAVYNKIDEVEQVTAAGLNALNDNFGGLKLVKLTQAEYNALTIKDAGTLYIILG